jgi:hypothetical protein
MLSKQTLLQLHNAGIYPQSTLLTHSHHLRPAARSSQTCIRCSLPAVGCPSTIAKATQSSQNKAKPTWHNDLTTPVHFRFFGGIWFFCRHKDCSRRGIRLQLRAGAMPTGYGYIVQICIRLLIKSQLCLRICLKWCKTLGQWTLTPLTDQHHLRRVPHHQQLGLAQAKRAAARLPGGRRRGSSQNPSQSSNQIPEK